MNPLTIRQQPAALQFSVKAHHHAYKDPSVIGIGARPDKMGRPSLYSPALALTICARIAEGESLRAICLDDDMPAKATVLDWANKNPDFADQYARARAWQGEADADNIGYIRQQMLDGLIDYNVARVAIDSLKWSAGKRLPKKYGDSIAITGAGGGPLQVEAVRETLLDRFACLDAPSAAEDGAGGDDGGRTRRPRRRLRRASAR